MSRLIDADALGIGKCNPDVFHNKAYAAGWNEVIDIIQNAPTVEAVPVVHAEWINEEHYFKRLGMTIRKTICSVCHMEHEELPFGEFSYCPNCGAKMDGACRERVKL